MTATQEHAAGSTAPLKVLQITDTHLFGDPRQEIGGVNTDEGCRQVFELVAAEALPADLLLLTGDLVHDATVEAYDRLYARCEKLGVPGLVIPGNHDDLAVMAQVFSDAGGQVRWRGHQLIGSWQMVMLDSTVPGQSGGHLAAAELERLDVQLGKYPEHHAVISLHHHPLVMGSDWIDQIGVDNGIELFAVLERHACVRAVIWGHVHQEYQGEYVGRNGPIMLLACPSTCVQFAPGETRFTVDDQAPGYRLLELAGDGGIKTIVHRISSAPGQVNLQLQGY